MSLTRVIAITGCDSGLGWAIAARSAREGLVTVAGMFGGAETDAANALKKLSAHPCPLDVTSNESVRGFKDFVSQLLKKNPNYTLYAVVNNAGVMTIGDFEWQTPTMIENTINVNLHGTMRVVSAFLPDLRKSVCSNRTFVPRIINVASHCGLQPLPGFGVYSASKAGVLAFTKALRYEQRSHGLSVVAFVPGGFVTSSNIISNQSIQEKVMMKHLNEEQQALYGKKILALTDYLMLASPKSCNFDSMKDEKITETFINALTVKNPQELYKVESWRYRFYYNLLKLPFPETVKAWLIKKFLNFPE